MWKSFEDIKGYEESHETQAQNFRVLAGYHATELQLVSANNDWGEAISNDVKIFNCLAGIHLAIKTRASWNTGTLQPNDLKSPFV